MKNQERALLRLPNIRRELVNSPLQHAYVTSVGVLQWAINEFASDVWQTQQRSFLVPGDLWRRLSRWARVLLPE